jgi:hypothetical protein
MAGDSGKKGVEVVSVIYDGNLTGDISISNTSNTIDGVEHKGVSVPEGVTVTYSGTGEADTAGQTFKMPDIETIMRQAMAGVGNVSADHGEVKVGKIQTGSTTNSNMIIGNDIKDGGKSQAKEPIQADEITMPWKSGSITGCSFNNAPIVGKYVAKMENGKHVMKDGLYVYVRP